MTDRINVMSLFLAKLIVMLDHLENYTNYCSFLLKKSAGDFKL
jgi:hypothetical protein